VFHCRLNVSCRGGEKAMGSGGERVEPGLPPRYLFHLGDLFGRLLECAERDERGDVHGEHLDQRFAGPDLPQRLDFPREPFMRLAVAVRHQRNATEQDVGEPFLQDGPLPHRCVLLTRAQLVEYRQRRSNPAASAPVLATEERDPGFGEQALRLERVAPCLADDLMRLVDARARVFPQSQHPRHIAQVQKNVRQRDVLIAPHRVDDFAQTCRGRSELVAHQQDDRVRMRRPVRA